MTLTPQLDIRSVQKANSSGYIIKAIFVSAENDGDPIKNKGAIVVNKN